jgi:hypothetical protein
VINNPKTTQYAIFTEGFLIEADVTSDWTSSKGTLTLSRGESTVIALIVPSLIQGENFLAKLVTAAGSICFSLLRVKIYNNMYLLFNRGRPRKSVR